MNIIYICSPYAGEIERNVQNARKFSKFAVCQGFMPLTPHLLFPQFLDDGNVDERALGMKFGIRLLDSCTELWAFGETSSGMAMEIAYAVKKKIPVRWFNADCEEAV